MTQQQGIPIITTLSDVYPGITGELENRHTSLYSLIHMSFQKAYEGIYQQEEIPQYYVCVNRTLNIVQVRSTTMSISMGCQNGIILAFSKTFKDASIFVNCKGLETELQFTCKGQFKGDSQETQLTLTVKKAIEMAIEDCSPNALFGGIIFFQSQLSKHDKTSLLMAFTLAVLTINGLHNDYTIEEIQNQVSQLNKGQQVINHKYHVGKMLVQNYINQHDSIPFPISNIKFVVGDILLNEQQQIIINHIKQKLQLEMDFLTSVINRALNTGRVSLNEIRHFLGYEINKFKQVCHQLIKESYTIKQCEDLLQKDLSRFPAFSPKNRLQLFFGQYTSFQSLLSSQTEQTVNNVIKQTLIRQKSLGIISQRIDKIINACSNQYSSACCLVQNKYLLILTTKQKFMWQYETFKKNVLVNQEGQNIVEGSIQHLLFSTGPSLGYALLDLSSQMWY